MLCCPSPHSLPPTTRKFPFIMLYNICILIWSCFQLFVQISFKTRLWRRKYCSRGRRWNCKPQEKRKNGNVDLKRNKNIIYLAINNLLVIMRWTECFLIKMWFLWLFFLRVGFKIAPSAVKRLSSAASLIGCHSAVGRTTTLQTPATRDFLFTY